MQFIKTRIVKNPERNVAENAGIDFYIPENTEEFRKDLLAKNITKEQEATSLWSSIRFLEINATDSVTISKALASNISFITTNGFIEIAPHRDVIIPSGIRSKFGPDLALIANNKSGIATKKKLVFGASVIDASYQGEWHLHLINTSDDYQTVECGKKIIQFIPHLISTESVEIVDMTPEEFYKDSTSTRGEGWAGSTDSIEVK